MKRRSRIRLFLCALGTMLPCAAAAPAHPGAGLDRLFTTVDERAAIDRLRRSPQPPAGAAAADSAVTPLARDETRVPASVRLDGVVRRSDGSDDLWLDGRTGSAGGTDAQGRTPVRVPGSGQRVWMKPGQVFDTATGKVRESYRSGQAGP